MTYITISWTDRKKDDENLGIEEPEELWSLSDYIRCDGNFIIITMPYMGTRIIPSHHISEVVIHSKKVLPR